MWIVLKGDLYQGISKRNLLVFMLAIFGIKNEIELKEKVNKP